MFSTVDEYLDALKEEMQGVDSATQQDALVDAEEHLRTALETASEDQPEMDPADALSAIIEDYGTPEETAAAYAEVERLTAPALAGSATKKQRSGLGAFFAIYADPKAWGALLYMLIAFVTGIIYFTWAVTGVSVSISFAIFIFGLPVALLFLLSVRGIAWLEGRLVEALLGVRMPRRSLPSPQNTKLLERIKALLTDKHTWFSLIYMVLQFALGTIYFVVLVTVFAISLSGIAVPIIQEIFGLPFAQVGNFDYFMPHWGYPLTVLAGLLLWTVTLHLVKWVGGLHGRFAKAMLVAEQG
ncbi:MAG: sensor domain-containing protein [Anaerolineales bacterium]|uniref:Sensor domain-containing protein n=1 Tax=Candidatus Desulfolinea nitratireducens TaxID=2841698 RepID=A0A8J6NJA1_9CHLR|nr:sensor domain-containing protein [Candidatus Desulfolinea nitratireducens]MBL6959817.1 sensor domain-containing protein [Anaerolineales bacterium]